MEGMPRVGNLTAIPENVLIKTTKGTGAMMYRAKFLFGNYV